MNKRQIQNMVVITAALGATVLALYTNSHWLTGKHKTGKYERCYGVVNRGKNDCGNAKHACASQSINDGDLTEFVMVPKGLCDRIEGGRRVE